MRRDLDVIEREFEAGIPGQWGGPGASARGCYVATNRNARPSVGSSVKDHSQHTAIIDDLRSSGLDVSGAANHLLIDFC